MGVSRYLLCLWPGCASLWLHGRNRALIAAVAFGLLLDFAFVLTWLSPELLGTTAYQWPLLVVAWVSVLWFWIAGFRSARRQLLPSRPASSAQADQLFRDAQHEYLKGHWLEVEALVGRVLAERPDDVEAGLLLASALRRSERLGAARERLRQAAENDLAGRWQHEIVSELRQIEQRESLPLSSKAARAA